MVEIEAGSDAASALRWHLNDPKVYLIRVDVRADGIAVKANEGMWSPTLSVEAHPEH